MCVKVPGTQDPEEMELSSRSELQNRGSVEFQQNLLSKVWQDSSGFLGAEPASRCGVSLTGSCLVI